MRKICTLILLFISLVGFTQNESPKIRFIQDSTMLGELVEVQLMYKHSKELEVLFPDSAYSYFPFEFVKKEAYTTSTKDSISIDSTIYTLQTFELDKIQTLQLDITLFSTKDSFKIKTNTDTIFLVEMIEEISDTTTFKTNTVFNEVETEFNYPYFLIGFGILLILLIIYIIVFGKKTINKIKVWKLKSGYKKFEERFNKIEDIETLQKEWKIYLSKLKKQKIEAYTTKEINLLFNDETITSIFKNIDAVLYGNQNITTEIEYSKKQLTDFAFKQLNIKIDEINAGGK